MPVLLATRWRGDDSDPIRVPQGGHVLATQPSRSSVSLHRRHPATSFSIYSPYRKACDGSEVARSTARQCRRSVDAAPGPQALLTGRRPQRGCRTCYRRIRTPRLMASSVEQHQPLLRDAATARRILRQMMLIRRFEERDRGAVHARPDRRLLPPQHRRGGDQRRRDRPLGDERLPVHELPRPRLRARASASEPGRVMAELFGKATGVAGGYGGSMHLLDVERRFLGGWGIVGGHLPIAVGAALALDYTTAPTASCCASSATARPTSAPSTRRSTWPRSGTCRSSSRSSTTSTAWARRSRRRRPSPSCTSAPAPTGCTASGSTATTSLAVREARRRGCCARPATSAGRRCSRRLTLPLPRPLGRRRRQGATARRRRSTRGAQRDPIERFAPRAIEAGLLTEDEIAADRKEVDRRGPASDPRGCAGAEPDPPTCRQRLRRRRRPRSSSRHARRRSVRRAGGDAHDGERDLSRGAAPGARRGARARRARLPDGRGDRPLRRLLQGDAGLWKKYGPQARRARRRSPRRASSAPASARRCSACGRSSRS